MWHSFPSPGSEGSRALTSSCWSWQCTMLPESPPRDFLRITLRVLGRKYDRAIGKVILSHLSPQWTDKASKATEPVPEKQKSIVGYQFTLSQLLPAPSSLGCFVMSIHISDLLAGALLGSRGDWRARGRRKELLLPVCFLGRFLHPHSSTAVAVPSRDSSWMQFADFSTLVGPLLYSPLRNTRNNPPRRSGFNSMETLLWGVKF